jgi:hypothetical protein
MKKVRKLRASVRSRRFIVKIVSHRSRRRPAVRAVEEGRRRELCRARLRATRRAAVVHVFAKARQRADAAVDRRPLCAPLSANDEEMRELIAATHETMISLSSSFDG